MHFLQKLPIISLGILILLPLFFAACSNRSANHWFNLVPAEAPFVIVPEQNQSIADLLDAPYMPLIDDITPSALQLTDSVLNRTSAEQTRVEALILYTDQSNQWQPVWIIQHIPGLIESLKNQYQSEFAQNRYAFKGYSIERLQISDRELFIVESGDYVIFSESSLGIENSLRAVTQDEKRMNLSANNIRPHSFIANTESLPNWVMQLAEVSYRPQLHDIFRGGTPIHFQLKDGVDENGAWQLTGDLKLSEDSSAILRSISSPPKEFTLDRYIPQNAAAFSIFQLEPRAVPPNGEEPADEVDRYLSENTDIWRSIAASLNAETAFVSFPESGAESTSEYLFLRHLSDASSLREQLTELSDEDMVEKYGNTFMIQSPWLGSLIGSELNPMRDFFLHIHNDVAIMAQRRGLAESVPGDASSRRVMYYDDDYMMARDSLNSSLSSLTYVDMQRFSIYVQPWLFPENYFNAIASNLDLLVISTLSDETESTEVSVQSYQREIEDEPYRERWIFPVTANEITGKPVLADINSNSRNEVIFSTTSGSVYALATDGTEMLQVSTENNTPQGPPIVFDWYGNNQNVVLQAAGNSVYAWNTAGTLLPNFPVILNEEITTPLIIQDVTRNGLAEIVVATADRSLHILNSRGQPISGWPQEVNSVISSAPVISQYGGEQTIIAVAENAVHAWNLNGEIRNGFPLFMDTPMYDSPTIYEDHLLSSGRNGNLYSIGTTPLFSDSLASDVMNDSLIVQQLEISQGSLNTQPQIENILLRDDDGFFREDLILIQSNNGSVFLYNTDGVLRFTKSMGQPASGNTPPVIVDINKDQQSDLVSLADFGRLYAWNILTDERLYDLPTTGMSHPVITDLYGDGNNEIIAFTREGMRCWTIFQTRTESGSTSTN